MKTRTMISVLLLSAVCVTPAFANWFSRPHLGINLNIGSAPNPTPQDLQRLYGRGPVATAIPAQTSAEVTSPEVSYDTPYRDEALAQDNHVSSLEGRTVFGARHERLGYILAVDTGAKLAELQTPRGIAITVPTALLVRKGDRVVATTMSRADVMAMAKTQTGRTVALNVDMSGRIIRG